MPAGKTYEPIATTTTSSNASTVTFSSFTGYTDLVMTMNFSLSSNAEVYIRFNSDTNTNYSRTYLEGNGSSSSSARTSDGQQINILGRSSQMVNIIHFVNYANTTTNKILLARFSSGNELVGTEVGMWRNTNAITSIGLSLSGGYFIDGSVITLYGIAAA